jgi:hypothetical protein
MVGTNMIAEVQYIWKEPSSFQQKLAGFQNIITRKSRNWNEFIIGCLIIDCALSYLAYASVLQTAALLMSEVQIIQEEKGEDAYFMSVVYLTSI